MSWVTPPVVVGLGVSVAAMAASTFTTAVPPLLGGTKDLSREDTVLLEAPHGTAA
jgi:hypothetical protein